MIENYEQYIKEKDILEEFKKSLMEKEEIVIEKCEKVSGKKKPDFRCECKHKSKKEKIYIEITVLPEVPGKVKELMKRLDKRDIEIVSCDEDGLPSCIKLKVEGLSAEIIESLRENNLNIRVRIQFLPHLFTGKGIFKGRKSEEKKEKFKRSLLEYIKKEILADEEFRKGYTIIKKNKELPEVLQKYIFNISFEKHHSPDVFIYPVYSNEDFSKRVKEVISKKESKRYNVDGPVWLVIKIEDKQTRSEDAEQMLKHGELSVNSKTFNRIYLLFDHEGYDKYPLLKIWERERSCS